MWPVDLSVRLPVFGLVGFYPANYLIGCKFLHWRIAAFTSRRMGHQHWFPRVVPLPWTDPCTLLTRPPLNSPKTVPRDLHVLGTPPAFILSQDQTLVKIPFSAAYCRLRALFAWLILHLPIFLSMCFAADFTDRQPQSRRPVRRATNGILLTHPLSVNTFFLLP